MEAFKNADFFTFNYIFYFWRQLVFFKVVFRVVKFFFGIFCLYWFYIAIYVYKRAMYMLSKNQKASLSKIP